MKPKTLTRRHLHRILALKTAIDTMETELCKLLHVPASLMALRDKARARLIPASLRKKIAELEEARLASGDKTEFPLLTGHFERRAAVRSHVKKTMAAGWNRLRRSRRSA
jgi:hypothetical protein